VDAGRAGDEHALQRQHVVPGLRPSAAGLSGPRFRPWFSWVASASTPATMGADSDVPDWESIVLSGTERIRGPVIRATPFW
jgi:hypothetical protein